MASFLSFIQQASSLLGHNGGNNGCSFTISCAGDTLTLPVIPGSYEAGQSYNNGSVNVNALGEINMLGKRNLMTISFSSFFPAQQYEFGVAGYYAPYEGIRKLQRFAQKGQPCKLIISGTNINTAVTIDNLNFREKDGTGDVYFDLSMREYRYILPNSNRLNETTQLSSRVAESLHEREVIFYPGTDLMDAASEAVGQIFPINEQGVKKLSLYKKLVKLGFAQSNSFKVTRYQLTVGDASIRL